VVGGGPTGVETAGALAELMGALHGTGRIGRPGTITIVDRGDALLGAFSDKSHKYALEKLTREYCDAIAANAPLTMRAAKRIIGEVVKTDYDDAKCDALVKECFDSADYTEGRKAFMEKRKPVFKGS